MHKLLSSCCEPFQTDVVVIPSGAVEWNQSPSTSHWHLSWQASETGCLFEGILRLFPDWKLTNSSKKLMVGRWHVLFKWSLFSGHVDFRWVYKVKYVWYHVRWWMHGPWSKDRTFEGSACKYTWMTCTYAFIFLFYSRISRQFCIWTRSEPTPSLHVILVSVCSLAISVFSKPIFRSESIENLGGIGWGKSNVDRSATRSTLQISAMSLGMSRGWYHL